MKKIIGVIILWAISLVIWSKQYLPDAIMDDANLTTITFVLINVGLAYGLFHYGFEG